MIDFSSEAHSVVFHLINVFRGENIFLWNHFFCWRSLFFVKIIQTYRIITNDSKIYSRIHVNLMMEKQEELNLIFELCGESDFYDFSCVQRTTYESKPPPQCIDRIGYASSIHINV